MQNAITVENLKKNYGAVQAVKGIDFYVQAGTLFAFLGPNGAGKSTTIDILCTLLAQDGGKAVINGYTVGEQDNAIRRSIGVVFQDSILDPLLTVNENLKVRAGFYGLSGHKLKEAVAQAANTADVTDFLNRPYGKLSGGQRRRADIARALVNTPKVLFLDEPTTGLDPKTKEDVWQTVTNLQKSTGMTIFLTTHYMEEAATADYIVLINKGEIAAKGTPYNLKEEYSSDILRIKAKDPSRVLEILGNAGLACTQTNGLIVAELKNTLEAVPVLQVAKDCIESFEVVHGSMNDVFLSITGGELQYA